MGVAVSVVVAGSNSSDWLWLALYVLVEKLSAYVPQAL